MQPTIYISSTVSDLLSERQETERAAKSWGLRVVTSVTQEGYTTATALPTLEACRRELAKCDVYVGIVAWRYGSRPPGSAKSYTEHEYDFAGEQGIPRLMFFSCDADTWRASERPIDDEPDLTLVQAFRKRVTERGAIFENTLSFTRHVMSALGRYLRETPAIDPLLPHLCDRQDQVDELARRIPSPESGFTRPIVAFIRGAAAQLPATFAECVARYHLPRILLDLNVRIQNISLEWPHGVQPARCHELLETRLRLEFQGDSVRRLGEIDAAVVIHVLIPTDDRSAVGWSLVREFLGFWHSMVLPRRRYPVVVLVSAARLGLSWRDLRFVARFKARVALRHTFQNLLRTNDLDVIITPELTNVLDTHVRAWASHREVQRVHPIADLDARLHELFGRRRSRPMQEIAPVLSAWLANRPSSGRTS